MTTALYTKDASIRGACITHLLFMGFNVFSIDKISKLYDILDKKDAGSLILDLDDEDVDWIRMINTIKQEKRFSSLYIIAISSERNKESIYNIVMECGINALFYKKQPFANFINKIIPNIMKIDEINEKRKFTRIVPDNNEMINVEIMIHNISEEFSIKGKVKDISASGVAIHLDNSEELFSKVENDTYINSLNLRIDDNIYSCDGFVLRKENNFMAVKYIKTNSIFKNGLGGYISDKINF